MDITLKTLAPSDWKGDVVVASVFEHEDGTKTVAEQLSADITKAAPWLAGHAGLADVSGKSGEVRVLYGPQGTALCRVMLVGLGRRSRISGEVATLKTLRTAAADALCACRDYGMAHVLVSLQDFSFAALRDCVKETACGALLALYRQTAFKSDGAELLAKKPDPVSLCLVASQNFTDDLQAALTEGAVSARSVCLAKDLINTPANHLHPVDVAEFAMNLAKKYASVGMRCEVLNKSALESLGTGALLAVGAGSVHEPRMVVLEYSPKGHADEKPKVFVGKGITFDSGGISLKPAAGMERMKGDMAGSAAVLGLFAALGELTPSCRVVGVLALAENMPSGTAIRPGDVIKTLSGKTVEIVNTDAEGRLVLCDALTFAQQRWQPASLVNVATLTGACAVALGTEMAGLFSNDPLLQERLRGIGERVGEPYWPMPLAEGYFEKLKSETADFTNCGPREGGACIAAMFLAQFVFPETRWAHLDIAGTSYAEKKGACACAGGVGYAVRTFIEACL